MKRAAIVLIISFTCMSLLPGSEKEVELKNLLPETGSAGINLEHADTDSMYLVANNLYQQGQFEPALEIYNCPTRPVKP